MGRCTPDEWNLLNKQLITLNQDKKNTVGAISRYSVVDFLPIMGNPKMAIYIPREMAVEEIDWKLYFTPFISDLWQMLLVSSVVLAISLYLMEYIKLGKRPVRIDSKTHAISL